MAKAHFIRLEENDLGQLLDGLQVRAKAGQKTADYHRKGKSPPNFIVEECNDADETAAIAAHYRSIISKIERQMKEQL